MEGIALSGSCRERMSCAIFDGNHILTLYNGFFSNFNILRAFPRVISHDSEKASYFCGLKWFGAKGVLLSADSRELWKSDQHGRRIGGAWEAHGRRMGGAWEVHRRCMGGAWEAVCLLFCRSDMPQARSKLSLPRPVLWLLRPSSLRPCPGRQIPRSHHQAWHCPLQQLALGVRLKGFRGC